MMSAQEFEILEFVPKYFKDLRIVLSYLGQKARIVISSESSDIERFDLEIGSVVFYSKFCIEFKEIKKQKRNELTFHFLISENA